MRHAEWMERDERLDEKPPYLTAPWRSVPSIAAAFPELASRACVDYTVIADMGKEQNPILMASRLPQAVADHIVELHNRSLPQPSNG